MRAGFAFRTDLRVRFSEIDGQSVVFNSRYLEYADVAIAEYWRAAGVDLIDTHVVKAGVQYLRPLRYDDTVAMYVRTDRIGTSSLTTTIEMCRGDGDEAHASVELVHVLVDLTTGRPVPIGEDTRARLAALDGRATPRP